MYVRRWMTSPAILLPTVTPVREALDFMSSEKIRRVPVLRDGALAGIVTRTDLESTHRRTSPMTRLARTTLGDVMTTPVKIVAPDDALEQASQIMLANEISGLPVVEFGRVVGMITESDIFKAFNEIMGGSEKGARMLMRVGREQDLLETIRRRLKGLAIRSLATYRTSEAGDWEVVVRVCGRLPLSV
ncbi:MAG: CBS domain-containing protein [Planctomycetes bacterium]|nr:CBS domain-containing protein [Planctomycetota bacterium]